MGLMQGFRLFIQVRYQLKTIMVTLTEFVSFCRPLYGKTSLFNFLFYCLQHPLQILLSVTTEHKMKFFQHAASAYLLISPVQAINTPSSYSFWPESPFNRAAWGRLRQGAWNFSEREQDWIANILLETDMYQTTFA